MANVTINGASFTDVHAIVVPQTGGGIVQFTDVSTTTAVESDVASGKKFFKADGSAGTGTASGGGGGGDSWSWMGKNPTLVQTFRNSTIPLSNTTYSSWTPSTTASKVYSAVTHTVELDFTHYTYWYISRNKVVAAYTDGVTDKRFWFFVSCHTRPLGMSERDIEDYLKYGYPRNTSSSLSIDLRNMVRRYSTNKPPYANYTNSSSMYGIYTSYPSYTPASPSYGEDTEVTFSEPALYARCSSTYFSTTHASAIDVNNTFWTCLSQLWRVDRETDLYGALYADLKDLTGTIVPLS